MFRIAFILFAALQAAPQDEIKDALAHAEALYYGARFGESIALLSRVDEMLKAKPASAQEKINTKLRLALAHIGLNETAKAKAYLMELYALDSNYVLDAAQFSPKVLAVAADAKAEQLKLECFTAQTDARANLESGNTTALFDVFRSKRSKCPALAAIAPEAAETFYRAGVAAYRQGEFTKALSSFDAAVTLSPEHEMALQYIDLTQSKLQVSQDRLLLQWQRNADARQWSAAAADYRQIMASNSKEAGAYVTGEYRKLLSGLVEKSNRSCLANDRAEINSIRAQISDMLPEASFGADIRGKLTPCPEPKPVVPTAVAEAANPPAAQPAPARDAVKPPTTTTTATPAPSPAPANTCVEMQPQLALTRLKTRVDPIITSDVRNYLKNTAQVIVRVKARISETGDVTVSGTPEGNPILNNVVRNAVAEWKFAPIRDQNGPRCVDTEIPIIMKLAQ
jgi:tetratricopeptide (TPR) repeat protein